jgi:hypothetical protein
MTTRRDFLRYTTLGAAGLCLSPTRLAVLAQVASQQSDAPHFDVVTLAGKPRERGRIHGESLRAKIHEVYERRLGEFRLPDGTTGREGIAKFVADTAFDEAIKRWTPELWEETKGIAEGAAVPFETAYAMQLVDEQWWYSMNAALRASREKEEGNKCTVAGASKTAGGPAIVAQNLDLPPSSHGATVVLRIRPEDSDLESLVVTDAGMIGANGINNRGLAVCVNALLQLDNSPQGLPVSCVVRGLLACRTLDEAERFVRGVKHASGQAYSIGDRERVVCYECSANRAVPFVGRDGADRFAHTNHPIVNDDRGLIGKHWQQREQSGPSNSRTRYDCVMKRLDACKGAVPVDTFKAILGSHDSEEHPICRHYKPGRGFTAACTIFDLGDPPQMHIAGNPPCRASFKVLGF